MSETTSEEQVPEPLLEARRLLDEGMLEQCLACLKPYWLKHETDTRAIGMFGELMKEAGRNEVARKLIRLTELLDAKSAGAAGDPEIRGRGCEVACHRREPSTRCSAG